MRTRVNDDTSNCSPMTTNPLGRAVYDDVGTMLDGANDVTFHNHS